jgi:signal transduction histidine kinase
VRKHARPERVEVRLDYLPAEVHLEVEDFEIPPVGPRGSGGNGFPPGSGGSGGIRVSSPRASTVPPGEQGYGLTGMRERAELLGGTLDAAPTITGFRVLLKVPA